MLSCCYAIIRMYGSKNILFIFPLFKKKKSDRKVVAKILISGQTFCHHLMKATLKYLCAQLGCSWTKNKEMGRRGGGGKKPNPCRVKAVNWCHLCMCVIIFFKCCDPRLLNTSIAFCSLRNLSLLLLHAILEG